MMASRDHMVSGGGVRGVSAQVRVLVGSHDTGVAERTSRGLSQCLEFPEKQ